MAKADITINGKKYLVSCDDGQESRLRQLADRFDNRVTEMFSALGDIGTERLFLAAALSIIDELEDTERRTGADLLDERISQIENAAIKALVDAAERIERLSGRVESVS